jgi:MFS family permease
MKKKLLDDDGGYGSINNIVEGIAETNDPIKEHRSKPLGGPLAGFFAVFVERAGIGVVVPYLPAVVNGYGVVNDGFWLGVILAVQGFGVFFGQIIFGRVSDSRGPKVALIISLLGTAVFLLLSGFCSNLWQLATIRLLAGLANPATPALTWCVNTTPPEGKKIVASHFLLALTGGWGAGLVLGGFSLSFKLVCVIVSCATLGALTCVVLAPLPPSIEIDEDGETEDTGANMVLSSAAWRSVGLLQWTLGVALGGVIFGLSAYVTQNEWGWDPAGTSAMFGVAVVVILLNTFCIYPRVLKRFGTFHIVTLMSLLLAVLLVLMTATETIPIAYIINFAFATLALTMAQPAALATAVEQAESKSPSSKGVVLGVTRGLDELGRACGPIPVLALYEQSSHLMGVLVPALLLAVSGAVFWLNCKPSEDDMPSGRDRTLTVVLSRVRSGSSDRTRSGSGGAKGATVGVTAARVVTKL